MPEAPKLLEKASIVARLKHLSLRTEEAYLQTYQALYFVHDKRHPKGDG